MKKLEEIVKNIRKYKYIIYILSLYFSIVFIKLFASLNFQSPWIMFDEAGYDNIARNIWILKGFVSTLEYSANYPPAYPLTLSVAYIFSDKITIYHAMLGINSLISTLIIFPSYLISKKFVGEKLAILTALLVTLSPSNNTYTFILMSENLFNVAFLFSVYFILNSIEAKRDVYSILSGISVFLLILTRVTGWSMVLAFGIIIFYTIFYKNYRTALIYIFSFLLPLGMFQAFKMFTYSNQISNSINYDSISYIPIILEIFTSPSKFINFLIIIYHEIGYYIIGLYFIFFIFAVYMFVKFKNVDKEIKILIIYILISCIGLVLMSTAQILIGKSNGSFVYADPSIIIGRYIEPTISALLIFGVIGMRKYVSDYTLTEKKKFTLYNISILTYSFFLFTFPLNKNIFIHYGQVLPLTYLFEFSKQIDISFIIYVLILISISLLIIISKNHSLNYILIFLILLSIIMNIQIYNFSLEQSNLSFRLSAIPLELKKYDTEKTITLLDLDDFPVNFIQGVCNICYLTNFWTKGTILFTNEISTHSDYVISNKLLPYNTLLATSDAKLYDMKKPLNLTDSKFKETKKINIGTDWNLIEGIYPDGWTKNESKIRIDYSNSNGDMIIKIRSDGYRYKPNLVKIYLNDYFVGTITQSKGQFEYIIPKDKLNNNLQILKIITNPWVPLDYGLPDGRELGIHLEWIEYGKSIQNNS